MKKLLAVPMVAAVFLTAAAGISDATTSPAPVASAAGKHHRTIWQQRWRHQSASWQRWAYATGSCESGNNPRTATGNGFLGAFQYVPSTWWSAPLVDPPGGRYIDGYAHHLPHRMPWKAQAVVSIKLAERDGTGHWPNCG